MKTTNNIRVMFVLMLMLGAIFVGCNRSAEDALEDPEDVVVENPADILIDEWEAIRAEYVNVADANQQVNLFDVLPDFAASLEIENDSSFQLSVTSDGQNFNIQDGTASVAGDELTLTRLDASLLATLQFTFDEAEGTLSTVNINVVGFDFDGDQVNEQATETIVWVRTNNKTDRFDGKPGTTSVPGSGGLLSN